MGGRESFFSQGLVSCNITILCSTYVTTNEWWDPIQYHSWIALFCVHVPCFYIHSPVAGHSSAFHFLATVNMEALISLTDWLLSLPVTQQREYWITWSRGTVLCNGCMNFHAHKWHPRVPFSPHSLNYLLPSIFLIVILTGMRCCLVLFWFAFPDDWWCGVFFHKSVDHLYAFLWEIAI